MPLIPGTGWRNSNDHRHTFKGSIINEEQHEALLQALVSDQHSEDKNILENHFGLQETFKRIMNGSSHNGSLEIYIHHQN